jgi:TatD DNase family protein
MRYFDSHAHYRDERFEREIEGGVNALLESLFPSSLDGVVEIGTDIEGSHEAVKFAAKFPEMYASVGIHPTETKYCRELNEDIESLSAMLTERKKNKIVALGEIGFDYHYDDTDKEKQYEYFDAQMALAEKFDIPVIIHDRDAHGDCLEMTHRHPNVRGVFHSYSGSAEMAKELLGRGWFISFSGVISFTNARRVGEVAATIPLERLLIETDCPYLAPHPVRGTLNHSGNLIYTCAALAAAKGIPADEMAEITKNNARELFGI